MGQIERMMNNRDPIAPVPRVFLVDDSKALRSLLREVLEDIEAFARYYGRSPEELGLINWRDEPALTAEAPGTTPAEGQWDLDADQEQLLELLRDSALAVAAAVIDALTRCPVKVTAAPDGQRGGGDDHPPDEDPPTGSAVSG